VARFVTATDSGGGVATRSRAVGIRQFRTSIAVGKNRGIGGVSTTVGFSGIFLPLFYVETEKPVEVVATSDGTVLRGQLDMWILLDRLWVLAIESERAEFSLKVGIPQAICWQNKTRNPCGLGW